jgi:transposase
LPLYTSEIYDQVIDLSVEKPPQILILEKEYLELKSEAGYWQAMHEKALSREKKLKETVKEQEGQIRDLRNRLFGKKSERKNSSKDESKSKSSDPKRPRGQQPGIKGHGRTDRPDLPQKKEPVNFPEVPICSKCGEAYIPDESKEAEIIEVEVKAYKRRIIRSCMKKCCHTGSRSGKQSF